jgi:hypothetical protein
MIILFILVSITSMLLRSIHAMMPHLGILAVGEVCSGLVLQDL